MSISRLQHITKIGVEDMGDLADSLHDSEVLRRLTGEGMTSRTMCVSSFRMSRSTDCAVSGSDFGRR